MTASRGSLEGGLFALPRAEHGAQYGQRAREQPGGGGRGLCERLLAGAGRLGGGAGAAAAPAALGAVGSAQSEHCPASSAVCLVGQLPNVSRRDKQKKSTVDKKIKGTFKPLLTKVYFTEHNKHLGLFKYTYV